MAEIRHLDVIYFSAEGGAIWIKFRRLVQNNMSTAMIWSKSKPQVEFQYGGRLGELCGMSSQRHVSQCRVLPPGEFNDMSSQSHVPYCRVLPPGEFNVMIPEPCATLQGERIPSAILKIIIWHIIFVFLMQFWLWRAVAFDTLVWLVCLSVEDYSKHNIMNEIS